MTTRDDAMCAAGVEPCPCAAATLLHAAKEREELEYTKGKLAGALAALRELKECVPPRDWNQYASAVLALDDRDRERSNVGIQGAEPLAAKAPSGMEGSTT